MLQQAYNKEFFKDMVSSGSESEVSESTLNFQPGEQLLVPPKSGLSSADKLKFSSLNQTISQPQSN